MSKTEEVEFFYPLAVVDGIVGENYVDKNKNKSDIAFLLTRTIVSCKFTQQVTLLKTPQVM